MAIKSEEVGRGDAEFAEALVRLRVSLELGEDVLAHLGGWEFEGSGSSGKYSDERIALQLEGDSPTEHHVVHLHEVMHKALNEDTSWGAALQIISAHGAWGGALPEFRASSRIVHESFATYMSVLLASSSFPAAEEVLADYPRYAKLQAVMKGVLSEVEGDQRRYFVATALARVCMQTPILGELIGSFPAAPSLAQVRMVDRPDARFAWLIKRRLPEITEVMARADQVLEAELGIALDELDERVVSSNDLLDRGWSMWEAALAPVWR